MLCVERRMYAAYYCPFFYACASSISVVFPATVAIEQYAAAFFFAFTKTMTSNTMIRTAADRPRISPINS